MPGPSNRNVMHEQSWSGSRTRASFTPLHSILIDPRRQPAMLRTSILRARPALRPIAPVVRPQWRVAQRFYATEKNLGETTIPNPAPAVTPTKASETASSSSRSAPAIQPATTPPTGPGTASIAPNPTPPKPKKRRFRRFLYTLVILSSLGFGTGVWYSLVSDDFHDFFTEYIPFGEDAVGFFEEREFRKRFPGRASQTRLHPQVKGENKITIPSKHGLTSRVSADKGSDTASSSSNASAAKGNTPPVADAHAGPPKVGSNTPTQAKKEEVAQVNKPTTSTSQPAPAKEAPKPAEAAKPLDPIDHLNVPAADEPVVQDVVKILNDLITAVNSDPVQGAKYSSALDKAKSDLGKVVADIGLLKSGLQKEAEAKIQSAHSEFDNAAKELVRRLEIQMQDQDTHWKEEYETEREHLSQSYREKLQAELDAAKKVYEQRLKNELLEQSIAMQRSFSESVRERVESERDGRLGKLNELSSSVQELEKLTSEWNSVIEANLKTQHLVVAVEAVKSALENQVIPKPFTTELAALKEIAADDPVVSAAIASINPAAYQRGIPNAAQLIDRFRRVSQQVRKAALLPEDAGVASHLASLAMSKVMFKKAGLAVGQDVEAVLARTETLLEEGDLDSAAREMNSLQGWAKVLSKDWLGECRRVLEVKQALDVIAAEARLQSLLVD
ncbi:hypothetical protein P154DRAFT_543630 [Amniculicola lignicola CBS 123094]|uniref:MICOS complex subunit MIC60 n=1 Tax=Amniculicola lignicola CBS 123094 TaxID=1392246 RepID=A0A6A5WSB9_9PLEO|nr:hypothetical protein P154DRAFT_543630 [Amniculicola lignicola CBS 123094]